MLWWLLLVSAIVGIAVLAVFAYRTFTAARELERAVSRARDRLDINP